MFLNYVDVMVEGLDSYTSLPACNVKAMRRMEEENDCWRFQEDSDTSVLGIRNGKWNLT